MEIKALLSISADKIGSTKDWIVANHNPGVNSRDGRRDSERFEVA